jgi:hypothetical protein
VQFDRFRWYPIKVAAELIGDAGAPHAIARAGFAGRIKHLGKSRLPEDGKRHINKSGEWKNAASSLLHGAARRLAQWNLA